jgi:pyruvate dehydrogenase E2 component (dihydrolipoamide acetyltransferase)
MATFEFKLPDIGEGVVEGEIVKWLVKEGDVIAEDQPLIEVMTDKATVTIPSPKRGKVVKTVGKEGDIAKVHHTLVVLELDSDGKAAAAPAPASSHHGSPAVSPASSHHGSPAVSAAPAAKGPAASAKVLATPVTRAMASKHGLDLGSISGTGPQGRVLKADVEALIAGGGVAQNRVNGASAELKAPARPTTPAAPLSSSAQDQRIPLKGLRKKIAEKMVRSKFTAPHYTFVEEMDATELVKLRKRLNEQLAASGDTMKLTFLPFICKAVVAAMRKFPTLNSNFDEAAQELIVRGAFNFGIAASTEEGLTVPVVKNVDQLSIRQLANEIGRLGAAARDRKLKMDELSGGSFTITSLGQTGGLFATPIINHPEVAILGVHKMRKRPVVKDDQVVVREMMYLSLSFDHRSIDGALGADFTYEIIRYLEKPELLFLEMV